MGSCAAPSAKGDDKFITTDYLQQCQMESYLGNKKLKVNTDSTRKGPGNTTIRPTDELAPTRQLKVIRPELVKNPDSQLVVAFNERLA